jgi:hypothetical protein
MRPAVVILAVFRAGCVFADERETPFSALPEAPGRIRHFPDRYPDDHEKHQGDKPTHELPHEGHRLLKDPPPPYSYL